MINEYDFFIEILRIKIRALKNIIMSKYYYYCEYCKIYDGEVKFKKSPLTVIDKFCSCGYQYCAVNITQLESAIERLREE